MRYVNSIMYMADGVPPPPSFENIESIVNSRLYYHFPGLPASYTQQQTNANNKRALPPVVAAVPVPPAGNNPLVSQGNPVFAPAHEINQAFFTAFTKSPKSIQDLRNAPKQPRVKNGVAQLCLSYHLKGSCFDICKKAPTHRPLEVVETSNMQTFMNSNL